MPNKPAVAPYEMVGRIAERANKKILKSLISMKLL